MTDTQTDCGDEGECDQSVWATYESDESVRLEGDFVMTRTEWLKHTLPFTIHLLRNGDIVDRLFTAYVLLLLTAIFGLLLVIALQVLGLV